MNPTSPWNVEGVEPEVREAAKLAARRAGVPLGIWLSRTIHKAAAEELRSGGARARADGDVRADGFEFQGAEPARDSFDGGSRNARPPAPTTEAVLESINRLAAKIEAAEERTAQALGPLADKVRDLSEQMETVKETNAIESSPLERALARMSERLDHIENGGRPGQPPRERRRQGFLSRLFSD